MAEIDRKIDDGNPVGGTFQFSAYNGGGTGGVAPVGGAAGQCYVGTTWASATIDTNCGGASLLCRRQIKERRTDRAAQRQNQCGVP